VAVVAAAGALAVVATARLGPWTSLEPGLLVALSALGVLASVLPVRFHWGSAVQAFTLEEGVFLAMLFTLPWHIVPLLMTGASIVGHGLVRREPLKAMFNAGQLALWTTAAAAVFHLVGPATGILEPGSIIAATASSLTLNLVSLLLVAELLRRLQEQPYTTTAAGVVRLNVATAAANLVFGLVIAVLVAVEPWAAALASLLMIGQFLGFRGYASVIEERERAQHLHELTRMLIDAAPTGDAAARFLPELCQLFGGRFAKLVVIEGSSQHVVRYDVTTEEVVESKHDGDPLFAAGTRDAPVRTAARSTAAAGEGYSSLAAPLRIGGRTIGGIAVYDRQGVEPWDEGDLSLLAALANEAAVAVRNAELFAEVERERERLASESSKLSDIVQAASDGIVMISGEGLVMVWNRAMTHITGTPAEVVTGKPWYQAMRLRDADGQELLAGLPSVVRRVLEDGATVANADVQVLREDAQWRWLRCSLAPIRHTDEGRAGAVLVARDVTHEREVADLKADFTATVSHELRTPLTPLRGFLATLQHRSDELDHEQRELIVTAMSGQLSRLEGLVSDLLAVAAADRGLLGVRHEAVDLATTVREVLDRDPWRRYASRIEVDLPEALSVTGDRGAITRILSSLLDNAVKHTAGRISVQVLARGDAAVLEVADRGPGMAQRDLERIFERFTRLGDHLHRVQGPGLGLAIARAYASELGGELTVRSDVATGSVFSLRLPLASVRAVERMNDAELAG